MRPILALALSLFLFSCSHLNPQSTDRSVAAESVWTPHPCREKGQPFRKYVDFILDSTDGKIHGRKEGATQSEVIKTDAKSVEEFFAQNKITACGTSAQTPNLNSDRVDSENTNSANENRDRQEHRSVRPWVSPVHNNLKHYYASLKQQLSNRRSDVRTLLHGFLKAVHVQSPNKEDKIMLECPKTLSADEKCVAQIDYGNDEGEAYRLAREKMMGQLDLRQTPNGDYQVFDHYCQAWLDQNYFIKNRGDREAVPGPNRIVHSQLVNCEHTWPQSKFVAAKGSHEFIRQKTDLHHIFSTDNPINSLRSNFEFAEVNPKGAKISTCTHIANDGGPNEEGNTKRGGMLGEPIPVDGISHPAGTKMFEPPVGFKGRIARALFYFSTRYNAGMSKLQEHYLRQWHEQEPVTEDEMKRNDLAYQVSGIRNPFVDMPELASQISRFCRVKGGLNDNQGKSDLVSEYCE